MGEEERLAALYDLDLLDTPPEKEYDDLVRLAVTFCGTPIGQFTLVDLDRTWFKANFGVAGTEAPREASFCTHTIAQPGILHIEDTTRDARFQQNLFVTGGPRVRFYAGIPIQAPGGATVGTLCVADIVPRSLTPEQKSALAALAGQFESHLELRAKTKTLNRSLAENRRLVAELQSTNDRFLAFMNNGPFVSYIKEADGTMVFYNDCLARSSGVDRKTWLGRKDHEIWPPDIAQTFRANDLAVIQSGQPVEIDEVSGPPEAPTYWKSFKFPCKAADGRMLLAGISIDVTADMAREAQLAEALRQKTVLAEQLKAGQHLLYNFLDLSPTIAFIKDEERKYVFYNKAFAAFHCIDQAAWLGRTDDEFFPAPAAGAIREHDLHVLATGEISETVEPPVETNGTVHRFRTIKFSVKDSDERTLIAGMAIDITAQFKREQQLALSNSQLELLAGTDPLTGLPNRRVFESRAAIEFSVARRKMRPLSILVLDLDNFKRRNDLEGHAAGDRALCMFAEVIRGCTRTGDLAARIGGEEFAYLLPETDSAGAHALATRIQTALREMQNGEAANYPLNNPLELTVSIGVSTIDRATLTWERLLARADDAMYEAKRAGKNTIVVHDRLLADLIERARRRPESISTNSDAPMPPPVEILPQRHRPLPAANSKL